MFLLLFVVGVSATISPLERIDLVGRMLRKAPILVDGRDMPSEAIISVTDRVLSAVGDGKTMALSPLTPADLLQVTRTLYMYLIPKGVGELEARIKALEQRRGPMMETFLQFAAQVELDYAQAMEDIEVDYRERVRQLDWLEERTRMIDDYEVGRTNPAFATAIQSRLLQILLPVETLPLDNRVGLGSVFWAFEAESVNIATRIGSLYPTIRLATKNCYMEMMQRLQALKMRKIREAERERSEQKAANAAWMEGIDDKISEAIELRDILIQKYNSLM